MVTSESTNYSRRKSVILLTY